jgi:hypothetical protein
VIPFLLLIIIAFGLVTFFIAMYTRRIADAALTDQFRAAESIANGHIPERWVRQINQQLAIKQALPILQPGVSGVGLVLKKIDRLYRFFEKSPFFENGEARELLLANLRETRQRWSKMTWEEIEKESNNNS